MTDNRQLKVSSLLLVVWLLPVGLACAATIHSLMDHHHHAPTMGAAQAAFHGHWHGAKTPIHTHDLVITVPVTAKGSLEWEALSGTSDDPFADLDNSVVAAGHLSRLARDCLPKPPLLASLGILII